MPLGISVLKVWEEVGNDPIYVGVTPGATHSLQYVQAREGDNARLVCRKHNKTWETWYPDDDFGDEVYIAWSPEINKQTPDVTDY